MTSYGVDTCQDELEGLRCSMCREYLSTSPVCGSLCKHCSKQDSNPQFRNESYEILAQCVSFPCSNTKQGCSFGGPFEVIKQHQEITCPYRFYDCPMCHGAIGIAVELLIHHRTVHQDLVIGDTVDISVAPSQIANTVWLLDKGDFSFFIIAEYDQTFLKLSAFYFTSKYEVVLEIPCQVTIGNEHTICLKAQHLSYIRSYAEFGKCTSLKESFKNGEWNLSLHFMFVLPECNEPFNEDLLCCLDCRLMSAPPIYKCSKNHTVCCECSDEGFYWCSSCEGESIIKADVWLNNKAGLHQYICRWKNCGRFFSCRYIKRHEQLCDHRMYKCLDCCWPGGTAEELIAHSNDPLVENHVKVFFGNDYTFRGSDITERVSYYLIAHKEVFLYEVKVNDLGTTLGVYYLGSSLFENEYSYTAYLKLAKSDTYFLNKTYDLTGDIRHEVLIPKRDTSKFLHPTVYCITLKIGRTF